MARITSIVLRAYLAFLFLGGLAWIANLPARLGFPVIESEWLAPYLGVATAAVLIRYPYGRRAGLLELLLGAASIAAWIWAAINTEAWLFSLTGNSWDKVVPGLVALLLLMEALRKACGPSITGLVWVLIGYGLLGHYLPQPLQASRTDPLALVIYLYTDTNAVLGLVLAIVATLVLAFLVFGRMMEVSGATAFFTDLSMSLVGHRRGGPAKVAVVASGLFGSISSSPVGNIMSTGVVTIPLMQKSGFRAHQAAAIEAVASTGGQIAPPVMGATAFLMAEFLQVSYVDVVLAALLPAFLYYACLFFHVDAIAQRRGLRGIDRSLLPRGGEVLRRGWIFIVPLAVLMYLLFWSGMQPAFAALSAAGVLLALAVLKRRFLTLRDWSSLVLEGAEGMLPILMIAGGAGIVVGIMNLSGLAQSLSFVLTQTGSTWGLLPMLVLTAILSVILGMAMPSTAIYVVLATVIAPSLIRMGVAPMAAHLFIFYFGVMSFLTPPVAVSSYVAAGLAKAGMWETGWAGMRYATAAFIVPFLWCYEPAILLEGGPVAIGTMLVASIAGLRIFASGGIALPERFGPLRVIMAAALGLAVVVVPVALGADTAAAVVTAILGAVIALMAGRSPVMQVASGISEPADSPPEIRRR